MNTFSEMITKVRSSPHYDRMVRSALPLKDYFGINHFWYYRITFSGLYSYFGTYTAWDEFCFENNIARHFPCLRHPHVLQTGINLMKAEEEPEYLEVLRMVWEKFKINFHFNLLRSTEEGIEAVGFGSHFNDMKADERILNELPLLSHFTKEFRKQNKKFFQTLDECQVDLPAQFGTLFYEQPKRVILCSGRNALLRQMGLKEISQLTAGEVSLLKGISRGYPASYIAKELRLSVRTIENRIAVLKEKLSCRSKVELIDKAHEIVSILLPSTLYTETA